MEYIQATRRSPRPTRGCVFCALAVRARRPTRGSSRASELAFVTLAKYPYNPGHLLVAARRATSGELEELSPRRTPSIAALLQRCDPGAARGSPTRTASTSG